MTSWHLLDDQLKLLVAALPAFDASIRPLTEIRAAQAAMSPPLPSQRESVAFQQFWIERPDTDARLRVLVYRPKYTEAATLPALLHMHGGGYVMGSADYSDTANEKLALVANCVVVSVDYRLAPETPAPGAVEDCLLAFNWLAANHVALAIDRDRIAVGGQSAGGGLAAALTLLARDRGGVQPMFQWLIYPMLDDRTATQHAASQFVGEYVWTAAANRFGWEALLGRNTGGPDVSPYHAAARAEDLTRLPSAYIAIGTLDLFLDENLDYARRLMRAGVPAELHLYPGACHGFDVIGSSTIGARFSEDAIEALRRALALPPIGMA